MSDTKTTFPWQPVQFLRAIAGGVPVEAWGYQKSGLVLSHHGWATPRTETRWSLVHVGSGGTILRLTGTVSMVTPVASEIADCSDWTLFDLPEGWRQTDPELPAKVSAICGAHPEVLPDTTFEVDRISDADARAVIEMREQGDA